MFITCRKAVKFTYPDDPAVTFDVKPGFLGDAPDWVAKTWYFKALTQDGIIAVIPTKQETVIQESIDKSAVQKTQKAAIKTGAGGE